MVECFRCGQEMRVANGCISARSIEFSDGETVDPIPYGEELDTEPAGKCHDCGAFPGQYHHPSCDIEQCPRCGGQYALCECITEEKLEMSAEKR